MTTRTLGGRSDGETSHAHAESEAVIEAFFRSTASVERSSEFVDDPARPHGPVLDRLAVATEDYHQQYWEGEGQRNPYCLAIIQPKPQKLRKSFQARVKSAGATV